MITPEKILEMAFSLYFAHLQMGDAITMEASVKRVKLLVELSFKGDE